MLKRDYLKNTLLYGFFIIYTLINVYPLLWMVINSFKTEEDLSLHPFGLPSKFMFSNYVKAWATAHIGTYFWNSLLIAVISVVVTISIGSLAAFFLSRFDFRGKAAFYSFLIFGMIIPVHATLVPLFILEKKLHMINSYIGIILPYIAFNLPIVIYILVSFMKSFSKEIEESAVLDGCGIFRIFASIIFPMARPAVATAFILNFVNNWNEFSFSLILISKKAMKTLPLGLANFAGEHTTSLTTQMAGLTLAVLPIIIIYLLVEKQLIQGMTAGAVKG